MVMEVTGGIPFEPQEQEESQDPFFLFGQEAVDDDDSIANIPYRMEEKPLSEAENRLTDNALMRYVDEIDPIQLDEETKRNDLSKICKIGSVKLSRTKVVEEYKDLFHYVSLIKGKLKKNVKM